MPTPSPARRAAYFCLAFLLWGGLLLAWDHTLLGARGELIAALVTWLLALAYAVRSQGWFSLATGYLGLLGLFHLGLAGPYLLGLRESVYAPWLDSPYLAPALQLTALACALTAAGVAAAGAWRRRETLVEETPGRAHGAESRRLLFWAALGLIFVGVPAALYGAARLGLFSLQYAQTYLAVAQNDPRLFGAGFRVILLGFIVAAAAATPRQMRWVLPLFLLVLGPMFARGFRGHMVVAAVALLLVWHQKSPRAARIGAAVLLAAVFVLAPVVKLARGGPVLTFSLSSTAATVLALPLEAGLTLRPVVETIIGMREGDAWWRGRSYLQALPEAIPNVGLWATGASAETPGAWVTREAEPIMYLYRGGLGYSAVAEAYLNFGTPGVVIFFLLVGFLLGWVEPVRGRDVHFTAWLMCFYAGLLWTVRNDFVNLVPLASWAFFFVYGLRLAGRLWRRQKPAAEAAEQPAAE